MPPSVPAEPSPASPAPSEPNGLPGTAWQLAELDGEDTSLFDITLEFGADGTVGGTGGCNSYGGSFGTDGEAITIADIFSTEMSCGQRDRAEQLYFQTLGEIDGWQLTDGRLELSEGDETRLVFEPKADEEVPADLDGTSWLLTTLDGEDIPADAGITAGFRGGRVEGSGGCNSYGGDYQVDGDAIRFSPLEMTMMLCAAPAGTWEVAFVDAMGAATAFRVEEERLILSAAEGADRLIFERTD